MAITNLQTGSSEWSGVNQTETVVLSTGATGANAVMVAFGSGDMSTTVSATANGVAMTKYEHFRHGWFGTGDGNCIVWGLTGFWTGDVTIQVTHSMSTASRNYGTIHCYSMMCTSGNPEFVQSGGESELNGFLSWSYDPGVYEVFAINVSQSYSASFPAATGSGVTHDTDSGNGAGLVYWHTGEIGDEPKGMNAVQSWSKGVSTSSAVAYLVLQDSSLIATPSAITLPVTVTTPTVTGIDFVVAYFASLGIDITIPEPGVVVKPRYTIRLVSEHGDMPGRLEIPSGFTQPIVGFVNGEPVWIELATHVHPTYRQRRVVMRPGITSPPEPVSNINGDGFVYMELDD